VSSFNYSFTEALQFVCAESSVKARGIDDDNEVFIATHDNENLSLPTQWKSV